MRPGQLPDALTVTDPDLRTVANGGYVINPNGYDIVFAQTPDGNGLPYEVSDTTWPPATC